MPEIESNIDTRSDAFKQNSDADARVWSASCASCNRQIALGGPRALAANGTCSAASCCRATESKPCWIKAPRSSSCRRSPRIEVYDDDVPAGGDYHRGGPSQRPRVCDHRQ